MKNNSKPSFEEVIKTNTNAIYRICRIYAISPLEPQDLFQEVIFEAWKSYSSFKGNSSINTWLYRIAINVCLRSKIQLEKKKSKTTRFDAIQFMATEEDSTYKEDERYKLLRECISGLNPTDTSLLVLHLEEMPYKEIAEVTGLTENHIAVKMKRIRKRLFDCMKPKMS